MAPEDIIEYIFSPESPADPNIFTPSFITQLLTDDPTLGLMLLTYLLEENEYDQDDGRIIADKLVEMVRREETPDTLVNLSPIGDDEVIVLLCLIELNSRNHVWNLIQNLRRKYEGTNHAIFRLDVVEYILHETSNSDDNSLAPSPWEILRDLPPDTKHDLLIQEEVRYSVETRYLEELEELMQENNRGFNFEDFKEHLDLLSYDSNHSIDEEELDDSINAFSITLGQAYFTISDRFRDNEKIQIDCLEKARLLLEISFEQAVDNPDEDSLSVAALTNSKFEELPWESITMQQVTSLINYIDTLLDGGVD